jgi:hypothetical protein
MSYKTYEVKVWDNGDKCWYLDDKLHREDGPAGEYANGTKQWFLNGKFHREDGPAIEYVNGDKFWYLDGVFLTKDEWKQQLNKQSCEGQVVEVNGVKYELQRVDK